MQVHRRLRHGCSQGCRLDKLHRRKDPTIHLDLDSQEYRQVISTGHALPGCAEGERRRPDLESQKGERSYPQCWCYPFRETGYFALLSAAD